MQSPFKAHISVLSKAMFILLAVLIIINFFAVKFSDSKISKPALTINTFYNQELSPPGVLVNPIGGIGNQLFIYACAYAAARHKNWTLYLYHNEEPGLIDPNRVFTPTKREFALDQFHIPEFNFYDKTTNISHSTHYNQIEYLNKSVYEKQTDGFIRLGGYCQSEVYWVDYYNEIVTMFQPSDAVLESFTRRQNLVLKEIQTTESVAVHVRRGDFLWANGFFVPISYQRNAIRRMIKILKERNVDSPVFFVFSDDIEFVKKQFTDFEKDYKFVYVSDLKTTSIQDFYFMMLCRHIILANSTFAWWAAYLNSNRDKIVIASTFGPDWWTTENPKIHGMVYHPSSWIIVDVFSGEHY